MKIGYNGDFNHQTMGDLMMATILSTISKHDQYPNRGDAAVVFSPMQWKDAGGEFRSSLLTKSQVISDD